MRLERGELQAIGPLTKVVAALDRYHGLTSAPLAVPRSFLPTPPLALTHAVPPLDAVEEQAARVTDFGA